MALSPWTWIVAGSILIAGGITLDSLIFFAVIGGLFVLIGVLNLILLRRRQREKGELTPQKPYPQRQNPPETETTRHCFVCGTINAKEANFCGHCGHRLHWE